MTPDNWKDAKVLTSAAKKLKGGVNMIQLWQKLIHLADRSEFGLEAANEYKLATNEDDAKRLEKVKKMAKQMVLKRKRVAAFFH